MSYSICGQVAYSIVLQEDPLKSPLLVNPTVSINATGRVPESRSSKSFVLCLQCMHAMCLCMYGKIFNVDVIENLVFSFSF